MANNKKKLVDIIRGLGKGFKEFVGSDVSESDLDKELQNLQEEQAGVSASFVQRVELKNGSTLGKSEVRHKRTRTSKTKESGREPAED